MQPRENKDQNQISIVFMPGLPRLFRYFLVVPLLIAMTLHSIEAKADSPNSSGGFLDFNLYPYLSDVDSDNSLTINAFAKLPHRLSYFSLTNFGNQSDTSALGDSVNFYTEQNIRWQVNDGSPFDLTAQFNLRSGEKNDRHRLGVRWRLNSSDSLRSFFESLHLNYAINLHAIQFDHERNYVWQLEHAFKLTMPYWSDRLYLAGFIDHTFNQDNNVGVPDDPIVGEAQLGYRLVENLYLIAEYRVNEYRRSDVNNLAVGIEYLIRW